MSSAFMTEVNTREPSPSTINYTRGNLYTYEDTETVCKRTHLLMWYHVTQLQKDERFDKELEIKQLTLRNNFEMNLEVKGIMNLVVFENWRNFAARRKANRVHYLEKKVVTEREEIAKKLAEEKGRRKSASFRNMHYMNLSFKTKGGGDESNSSNASLGNGSDEMLGEGMVGGDKHSLLEFQKMKQERKENMSAKELQSNSPHGTPNLTHNTRKLSIIQATRPVTPNTTVSKRDQADFCRRLSVPASSIHHRVQQQQQQQRQQQQQQQRQQQQQPETNFNLKIFDEKNNKFHSSSKSSSGNGAENGDPDNDSNISKFSDPSFTAELRDMYLKYKKSLKSKAIAKRREKKLARKQSNMHRFAKKPETKARSEADAKFHALSDWELEQKKELLAAQKKTSERLFLGQGAVSPVLVRFRVKRSVTMKLLQKEKQSMLQFLDRLQKPVERQRY